MTFLTILGVKEILCSFRLVLEGKTGKEIPQSSRLGFLERFFRVLTKVTYLDVRLGLPFLLLLMYLLFPCHFFTLRCWEKNTWCIRAIISTIMLLIFSCKVRVMPFLGFIFGAKRWIQSHKWYIYNIQKGCLLFKLTIYERTITTEYFIK